MKQGHRIRHLIQQLYQTDSNIPIIQELKWSLDKYNLLECEQDSSTYSKCDPRNSNDQLIYLATQKSVVINDTTIPYNQSNYKNERWFARLLYQQPKGQLKLAFSVAPIINLHKSINIGLNKLLEYSRKDHSIFYDTNYSNVIQSFKKSLRTINCLQLNRLNARRNTSNGIFKSVTYSSSDKPKCFTETNYWVLNVPHGNKKKHYKIKNNKINSKSIDRQNDGTINKSGDVTEDDDDVHLLCSMSNDSKHPPVRSILRNSNQNFYTNNSTSHVSFAPKNKLELVFEYPAYDPNDSYSSDEEFEI